MKGRPVLSLLLPPPLILLSPRYSYTHTPSSPPSTALKPIYVYIPLAIDLFLRRATRSLERERREGREKLKKKERRSVLLCK